MLVTDLSPMKTEKHSVFKISNVEFSFGLVDFINVCSCQCSFPQIYSCRISLNGKLTYHYHAFNWRSVLVQIINKIQRGNMFYIIHEFIN